MGSNAGPELTARAFERGLIARLMVANGIAGVAVTAYLVLAADVPQDTSRVQNFLLSAAAFVAGLALLSGFAVRRGRKILRPALAWLDAGTAPSAEQRAAVLALPRRVATFQLPYWITAAIVTAIAQVGLAKHPRGLVTVAATLQGGLFSATIGYLLAERMLRPSPAIPV